MSGLSFLVHGIGGSFSSQQVMAKHDRSILVFFFFFFASFLTKSQFLWLYSVIMVVLPNFCDVCIGSCAHSGSHETFGDVHCLCCRHFYPSQAQLPKWGAYPYTVVSFSTPEHNRELHQVGGHTYCLLFYVVQVEITVLTVFEKVQLPQTPVVCFTQLLCRHRSVSNHLHTELFPPTDRRMWIVPGVKCPSTLSSGSG